MDVTFIARVAHDADRSLLAARGDMSSPGWFSLDSWERECSIRGVKLAIDCPGTSAEMLHAAWHLDMRSKGWTLGTPASRSLKQHPAIMPWAQLSDTQRQRDQLFLAVVRALHPQPTKDTTP